MRRTDGDNRRYGGPLRYIGVTTKGTWVGILDGVVVKVREHRRGPLYIEGLLMRPAVALGLIDG